MRYIGPRPIFALLAIMVLCTVVFVMSIVGDYIVTSHMSPGWNEHSVPAPTLD